MIFKDVMILKEVADDLNDGKAFYDQRESGVGDYFWDSPLADIESLVLYAQQFPEPLRYSHVAGNHG